jgi:hypothetical protein
VIGGSRCSARGAFLDAETGWWVLLPDGKRLRAAHVPLDGTVPRQLDVRPPIFTVHLSQHAYSPDGADQDGEWLWPCVGGACTSLPVPISVRDRSHDTNVDVAADVAMLRVDPQRAGAPLVIDVVFRIARVNGTSPRAAAWRTRIEALRGNHVLPRP